MARHRNEFYAKHWEKRKQQYERIREESGCMLFHQGGRVVVVCPYDLGFAIAAKQLLEGKWRARTKTWTFPMSRRAEIKEYAVRIFGTVIDKGESQP